MVRAAALSLVAAAVEAARGVVPASLHSVAQCAALESVGGGYAVFALALAAFIAGLVLGCLCCACGLLIKFQLEVEYGRRRGARQWTEGVGAETRE